ncbi:MAG: hypothetical protein HN842_05790 [Gammaproteobacteria bacterium]|nr:hypothetical protein [Gammaproteobacteria bacterium]
MKEKKDERVTAMTHLVKPSRRRLCENPQQEKVKKNLKRTGCLSLEKRDCYFPRVNPGSFL